MPSNLLLTSDVKFKESHHVEAACVTCVDVPWPRWSVQLRPAQQPALRNWWWLPVSTHQASPPQIYLLIVREKKTGTLNHCVTAESSLIYIFRVRFTLLHVLHEGVLGYCLHDAHGTQTSKSEFQNSELPHWPAHGNKTSQITIISYGSFTSSVRKQWVKAGYFFNLFNIIIIEVIFRDRCNCCRNQPNFLN